LPLSFLSFGHLPTPTQPTYSFTLSFVIVLLF